MRTTTTLAALALSLSMLAACGGDSEETPEAASSPAESAESTPTEETPEDTEAAYCDAVETMKEPFAAFVSRGDASRADEALDAVAEVPPVAPEGVRAAWESFADSFTGARTAVESAGIEFEEFAADRGAAMSELEPAESQQLQEELNSLRPDDADLDAIEENVLEVCDISLDEED